MSDSPTRIRLNVISEVALEGGEARPIHMFRPGTFTDMTGRETTFSQEDVTSIVTRFAAHPRRKPPITERHDFGRAIGRLQKVWSDPAGNLYGLPKWNSDGKTLLENEVYDGFSCELDREGDGWALIGGSLTNYPAVGGLEPVTLAAPPMDVAEHSSTGIIASAFIAPADAAGCFAHLDAPTLTEAPTMPAPSSFSAPSAPVPARDDTTLTQPMQGVLPMSESIEPVTPAAPDIAPLSDPTMQARLDAYVAQINARYEQQQQQVLAQASAEFERRMREMEQRSTIETFARRCAATTADQPYAIPAPADELVSLLLETPAAVRGKWQALLTRITQSGLLSFDEIGSSGAGGEADDQWNALVSSFESKGMGRVDAIKAAAKAQPALYSAQSHAKRGGR